MKPRVLCISLFAGTALLMSASLTVAQEPDPKALREQADQLLEKARDQKAAGALDESERLAAKAKVLRTRANALESPTPSPEQARDEVRRERQRDSEAIRARMKAELDELHKQGRHEEAEQLEGQFQSRFRGAPDRPEGAGPRPRPEEVGELHRRMHHLRVAAENLHQAGLHEQAEQVQRQAERMERELRGRSPGPQREERHIVIREGPGPNLDELREQIAAMRAQMEDLRHALKELQNQLPKK